MVADGLGFALDDISETIEPVIAEESIKTEFLEVAPGQVAGVHQIARGTSAGKEKIFMELKMYVGARHPADTVVLERRAASHADNSRRHAWRRCHCRRRRQRHPSDSRRQRRPAHLARSTAQCFSRLVRHRQLSALLAPCSRNAPRLNNPASSFDASFTALYVA